MQGDGAAHSLPPLELIKLQLRLAGCPPFLNHRASTTAFLHISPKVYTGWTPATVTHGLKMTMIISLASTKKEAPAHHFTLPNVSSANHRCATKRTGSITQRTDSAASCHESNCEFITDGADQYSTLDSTQVCPV
ncbi:hypothetical protein ATANTOWER_021756 [Ataeniobius toweri]|uniref:Uncharacterized protein n=1 Tax=Ataeniobius toweri TaxID=208326 RepID=A0ABU7B1E3_9TELE|nr:hypothetical protein [Ataeniobius toweri]